MPAGDAHSPAHPRPRPKESFEILVGIDSLMRASHSSLRRAARSALAAYMCLAAQRTSLMAIQGETSVTSLTIRVATTATRMSRDHRAPPARPMIAAKRGAETGPGGRGPSGRCAAKTLKGFGTPLAEELCGRSRGPQGSMR